MKSSDVPSSLQKKQKFCVRFHRDLKIQGLQKIMRADSTVVVDPEGNPVTAWVTTKLTQHDLESMTEVLAVVESRA